MRIFPEQKGEMGAWQGPHPTERTQNGDSQGSEAAHSFNRAVGVRASKSAENPRRGLCRGAGDSINSQCGN